MLKYTFVFRMAIFHNYVILHRLTPKTYKRQMQTYCQQSVNNVLFHIAMLYYPTGPTEDLH